MISLSKLKSHFLDELTAVYPKAEILSFYYLLLKDRLLMPKTEAILQQNLEISTDDFNYFKKAVQLLKTEKPIQYILGSTEFYGLPFNVNEHVLIPRPETEELVDWILRDDRHETLDVRHKESKIKTENKKRQKKPKVKDQRPLTILDIGTGSGCIAISLAKNLPTSTVFALDISIKALEIAKENAFKNKVDITFFEQDILKYNSRTNTQKYDIIVSNPPYVRHLEKREIKNNVLKNEPHLALFVDDKDPLVFYDKIADFAKKHLHNKGKLFLEINQYLALETVTLLKQKGYNTVKLREDLFGNKRMIKASVE